MSEVNTYTVKNSILIIDDDKINRETLKRLFPEEYKFYEAENGLEGLEQIEVNQDKLCAIFLDVTMPVMDGMEVLRVLNERGITKAIPVFLITISTEYEIVKEGYELGVMDVIAKPVEPFVTRRRIQNIIELFSARETLNNTVLGHEKRLKESAKKQKEHTDTQLKELFHTIEANESDVNRGINQQVLDLLMLRAAVQSAYDMIICVNLTKNNYYMIDYDRFLTQNAGYDGVFDELIEAGASAVPESHRQLFADTFSRESLLRAYADGKKSVSLEHPQYADDGMRHMVATSVMFVDDPNTGDVLEITLSRYIDEEWEEKEKTKRILNDALIVAEQANKAKTDFLSQMSHDIRTPLNAINGMATIIEANLNRPEKIQECVDKIGISSKYLLDLINDILDFSKIESGTLSITEGDFDLRNMTEDVRKIVEERTHEKNHTLEITVDDAVGKLYKGDEFRIRQILINLLDNAYKYTPADGHYSLKVRVSENTGNHHFLAFIVEDNGIGISEVYLEKIFSPFVQCGDVQGRNGVGLGLAITQNLVHLMNGKINVESQVGKGTKFTVELPLEQSVTEEQGSNAAVFEKKRNEYEKIKYDGEKILVAEDNELNQEIVKTILEMQNLKVDIAQNGKEAVEKFEASRPGEYLMIFMDISMPVMNGHEATVCIRKLERADAKTIPIYALTANAFYSDVVEAKNSGMNGHISKPVNFEEVSELLDEIIRNKGTQRN